MNYKRCEIWKKPTRNFITKIIIMIKYICLQSILILCIINNYVYSTKINLKAGEQTTTEPVQLSMAQMTLYSDIKAFLSFGCGAEEWRTGCDHNGFFITHNEQELVNIKTDGGITFRVPVLLCQKLAASTLTLNGVNQWQLAAYEDFRNVSAGWSHQGTIECGQGPSALVLLAGESATDISKHRPNEDALTKTYENLPPHTNLKIKATAHFIDNWQGDTGFIRVDGEFVWTQSHDQQAVTGHSMNVCRSEVFPEGKFSVAVEVTVPHTANKVTISYGSTLPANADAIFGISSLSMYLRTANVV